MMAPREVGRDFPVLLLLCDSPSFGKPPFKITGEWCGSGCGGIFASRERGASGHTVRHLWNSQPEPDALYG